MAKIYASKHGSTQDLLNAVKNRIQELGGEVEMSEDLIEESEGILGEDCMYKLHDTYGAPQAGCETQCFDTRDELDDYLAANPDVEERIAEGYATIESCDSLVTI